MHLGFDFRTNRSHLYTGKGKEVVVVAWLPLAFILTIYMDHFHICPVSSFYQRILLPVSYSLEFLLGLMLNCSLLWCVCSRTRAWTSTIIYLSNLALADLLYVLALPALIISDAMGGLWPFGNIICKMVRFFILLNLHCSMMFLTSISVHRFLGVCFPISGMRLRTRRLAMVASGSVWLLALVEIFPTLFFAHTGEINNMTVCFEMSSPGQFSLYFPYGLFLVTAGFLVPLLVLVTCYCSMMKVLCSSRTTRVVRRSLQMLLMVCALFLVCFLPYHVARTVYLFVRVYNPEDCRLVNKVMISFKVWKPVVGLNCCVNPLLYFCSSGRHRQLLRTWLWSRNKKRVHPQTGG